MREVMAFGDNITMRKMLRQPGIGRRDGECLRQVKMYADSVIGRHNTPAIADF